MVQDVNASPQYACTCDEHVDALSALVARRNH